MRSTILLAFINAITMVPVMLLAKMELVIPLAVLLFLGSLIPMVGMLAAGGVLMLVALVMQSPLTALVMGIALFIAIQVEGNLLNAYILGKAVSIHPLAILATVTGGTLVGGVFGAFIAVPMVAIISNVIASVRAEGAAEAEFEAREAVEEALQGGLVEAWATPEPPPAAAAGPEGPDHATRT